MQEELDAIETVQRAVDRVKSKGRFAELELLNGIVLKIKPIAPILLQAVNREFQPPPVPKVFIEERGRDEENPNDPNYIKAVQEVADQQDRAVNDLILGIGTEVISVPEGYFSPEEDGWIEQVQFAAGIAGKSLHIDQEDKTKRYICWLRFYALENGSDIALVNNLPLSLIGIREEEVLEAMENFRSLPERGPDLASITPPSSENGDTANRSARRARPRNRRA